MKYPEMQWGMIEAVLNKLGGMDGVQRFLRGELVVSEPVRCWKEEDGVIRFTLPPTNGTVGLEWIKRLEKKEFRLSKWAKDILNSPDFKSTSGVTYEIAVLKGMLLKDKDRITKKIRAEADRRRLTKPNAEVACLIRENFSDEELEAMGLWWIVAMHEPIKGSDGALYLLFVDRGDGGRWLGASFGESDYGWDRDCGFAFVVSQVSS